MIIKVKVKPGSKGVGLEKLGDEYVVRVRARPEKGRANEEVIKLLAEEFSVHKDCIIIKTQKGRMKIVEVKR